jgi:hypothetical protein
MKPDTVFLEEMTDRELRLFLERHQTLYIPVGAMEQHGPHSPLGTDIYIPREIARRVAIRTGTAVVAPALPYTLSYPHRGFTGEFSLSVETFMGVVRDLAIAFARSGFRRICFLNGHYDNTYAIAYGCAQAAPELPAGARAFPFNYWDGMRPEQMQAYASRIWSTGSRSTRSFHPFPKRSPAPRLFIPPSSSRIPAACMPSPAVAPGVTRRRQPPRRASSFWSGASSR